MDLVFQLLFGLSDIISAVTWEAVFAGACGTGLFILVCGPLASGLTFVADFVMRYLLYIGVTLCTAMMGNGWFGQITGLWFVDLKPLDDVLHSMGW
jgi:hypothetical protein